MITQSTPETPSDPHADEIDQRRPSGIVVIGRRIASRPWLIGIVVIVIVVGVWLAVRASNERASAPHYLTAPVGNADISASVEETGTVNPVDEVDVGTQVSGTVDQLMVDYNSI